MSLCVAVPMRFGKLGLARGFAEGGTIRTMCVVLILLDPNGKTRFKYKASKFT